MLPIVKGRPPRAEILSFVMPIFVILVPIEDVLVHLKGDVLFFCFVTPNILINNLLNKMSFGFFLQIAQSRFETYFWLIS